MNDIQTPFDEDIRALATIDPAGLPSPEAHRSPQAQTLLEATITAPAHRVRSLPPSSLGAPAELGDKRRTRRWPWVAGAAAALTVAITLTPNLFGGDAYGSWTDVPAAASASDAAAAESYCRDWWLSTTDEPAPGLPDASAVERADLVLAEQRGEFTYTVLSDGSWSMDCLVQHGAALPWQHLGAAGSIGPAASIAEVPADGIAAATVGAMGGDQVDGLVLMMYGQVGAGVRDVVAHVPDVGDVAATVTNGFFAVWAPGLSQEGFAAGIGVTLYLQDGSQVDLTPERVLAPGQP